MQIATTMAIEIVIMCGSEGGPVGTGPPLGLLRGGRPPPLKLLGRKTRFSVCVLNDLMSLSIVLVYLYYLVDI